MKPHTSSIIKIFEGAKPRSIGSSEVSLVARQPIFDKKGSIVAYELLFRDNDLSLTGEKQQTSLHSATSKVIIDGFNLLRPSLLPNQRFFINFTEELLTTEIPSILPPNICTLEILETVRPSDWLIKNLLNLKQLGYKLALDDYMGQEGFEKILPIVDVIKVDVLNLDERQLRFLVSDLKQYPAQLLAEKVEEPAKEALCTSIGFSLFQGFFFSKPEVITGKKITPSQIIKTRLLAFSSNEEVELDEVVEIIQADVSLTLKLLSYVNSLYFGLPVKVKSIHHALMILGRVKLMQWLYVVTLADIDSIPLSHEVAYMSSLRAKFLEILAEQYYRGNPKVKEMSGKLFMIGLFSLLESILQMPFSEIASSVPIDDEVIEALEGKGKFKLWLPLVQAYERGNWEAIQKIANFLNIPDASLRQAYADAAIWTTVIYGESAS